MFALLNAAVASRHESIAMLWLCLYFPQLDEHQHHPSSLAHGQQLLEQLATWAGQFTSRVSLAPPLSLLLEIGGSLHYFQGLEALRQRIHIGLQTLGHQASMGIAPTPTAAQLIARSGTAKVITHREALAEALATLPVAVLDLDSRQADALQGLGCTCIGEVRALPVAGALRRLGKSLIHTLQKAHGERPDPRADWLPPAKFCAETHFLEPIDDVQQLRPGMFQLIETLCADLRRRDAGVTRLRFTLLQQAGHRKMVPLGLLAPSRDPAHLQSLLERRLERLSLTDGVLGITLRAGQLHAMQGHSERFDLLEENTVREPSTAWHPLVETLDNRLGSDCIHTLAEHPEHRPEYAWRYVRPTATPRDTQKRLSTTPAPAPNLPPRPFWLLPQPQALDCRQGQPLYHGPLVLEAGPERIEAGWWDGEDIARDYYEARNRVGQRLWVFHERRGERGWYLHGIFA